MTIEWGDLSVERLRQTAFMWPYGVDGIAALAEITPVCEELLCSPVVIFTFDLEPVERTALWWHNYIAAGFATFENACLPD